MVLGHPPARVVLCCRSVVPFYFVESQSIILRSAGPNLQCGGGGGGGVRFRRTWEVALGPILTVVLVDTYIECGCLWPNERQRRCLPPPTTTEHRMKSIFHLNNFCPPKLRVAIAFPIAGWLGDRLPGKSDGM